MLRENMFNFNDHTTELPCALPELDAHAGLTKVQKDKMRRHELGELFNRLSAGILGRPNIERTRALSEAIKLINSQKEEIQQLKQELQDLGREPAPKRQKVVVSPKPKEVVVPLPSVLQNGACLCCRKAKRRCDAGRPCARCVRMKKTCTDVQASSPPSSMRSVMCLSTEPSLQHLALEVATSSTLNRVWVDAPPSNSSVWRPFPLAGYSSLGDFMNTSLQAPSPSRCVSVRECTWDTESQSWQPRVRAIHDTLSLLAPPTHFQLVWRSTSKPGIVGMSVYRPMPPPGYVSMGDLCVPANADGSPGVPSVDKVMVVHQSCARTDSAQSSLAIAEEPVIAAPTAELNSDMPDFWVKSAPEDDLCAILDRETDLTDFGYNSVDFEF